VHIGSCTVFARVQEPKSASIYKATFMPLIKAVSTAYRNLQCRSHRIW
jgi:hypothetical protein